MQANINKQKEIQQLSMNSNRQKDSNQIRKSSTYNIRIDNYNKDTVFKIEEKQVEVEVL